MQENSDIRDFISTRVQIKTFQRYYLVKNQKGKKI
jgi:hypothetical protein